MIEDQNWIPNPEYCEGEEVIYLFAESAYPEVVTDKFGSAASCCICDHLTNGKKNGKPRCQHCYNNLVEPA